MRTNRRNITSTGNHRLAFISHLDFTFEAVAQIPTGTAIIEPVIVWAGEFGHQLLVDHSGSFAEVGGIFAGMAT